MSEEERHPKLRLAGIILIAIMVASVGTFVIAQTFIYIESSLVNVTVTDAGGNLTLNADSFSLFTNQTLRLTATLTGQLPTKANVPVYFWRDSTQIGIINTNVNGVAVLDYVVPIAGNFNFKANCTVTIP